MAVVQIKLSPKLHEAMAQDFFMNKPIRLGIITSGNEVAETRTELEPEQLRYAEYNAGAWVRPTMTILSAGSYNTGLDRWEFPVTLEWSFTAPAGGLQIKQIVIILGGLDTPRGLPGVTVGHVTYTTPLVVAAGVTQILEAPWTLS